MAKTQHPTVARSLRAPMVTDHLDLEGVSALLPSLVIQTMAQDITDPDELAGFLIGAIDHQYRVTHEDSKVFKGVIEEVEYEDRGVNGNFTLGTKAIIHFTSNDESQSINTGWVKYNGYDAYKNAWELALSNTLVQIAEDNIGTECLIRKIFFEAETAKGGNRVRAIADLIPLKNDSSDSKNSRRKSKSKSKKSSKEKFLTEEQLFEGIKKLKLKAVKGFLDDFSKDELSDLIDALVDEDDNTVAKLFELDKNEKKQLQEELQELAEDTTDPVKLYLVPINDIIG